MNQLRNKRVLRIFLALSTLITSLALGESSNKEISTMGRRLFAGEEELSGRIYTHTVDLPTAAIRCSNCHAVENGPAVARSTAPRLTRDGLLQRKSRRGGPATIYNRTSFCTMLRKGVDPAYIVIDVAMPRYQLTDTQCTALWAFLAGGTE